MFVTQLAQALQNYLYQTSPVRWQISQSPQPQVAAVLLALFWQQGEWHLPFILRNTYAGVHSGQIGFPGGRQDAADEDLIATALRETLEEIGVQVCRSQVIGRLHELYVPPSHTIVHPIVAVLPAPPVFSPNPREVAEVFTLSISYLRRPDIKGMRAVTLPNGATAPFTTFRTPANGEIWGATARMLSEFLAATAPIL
ncbi:MAG: CoA pyrophosphatase [Cytophagales bacterium]|nr:CoA pyrophosphatase [Bernardetiaceae bacterium]MDW8203725.1 CoA pyrophosphatase [Cytophagales bacterium]